MLPRSSAERRSRKRSPLARPQMPEVPNQDGVDADKGHVNPRQGKVGLRSVAMLAGAVVLMAAWTPGARADESAMPTTQARAYNAEWVPYLDPPEKPAAVCLVDSGVNITPDTPEDSPEGPIVKRLALDGGPGTAAGSSWEALHGTRMALVGAAPVNGWGAVGFWPGARIISIRAMPQGNTTFPFQIYADALFMCGTWAASYNVAAVNLSLACDCEPTAREQSLLEDRVVRSHANGMSVIAAAGNTAGPVSSPANQPGVFGVAAGDETGGLCTFSNRGSDIDATAAGCDLDLADPGSGELWSGYAGGTSAAAVNISLLFALVRSYRSDLAWDQAEALVAASAPSASATRAMDVEATFRAAGLGNLVDQAKARMPSGQPSGFANPTTPSASDVAMPGTRLDYSLGRRPSADSRHRLPRPFPHRLIKRGNRLLIFTRKPPVHARLEAWLQRRENREFTYRTIARGTGSARIALRVPPNWHGGRLGLRFTIAGQRRVSPTVYRTVNA